MTRHHGNTHHPLQPDEAISKRLVQIKKDSEAAVYVWCGRARARRAAQRRLRRRLRPRRATRECHPPPAAARREPKPPKLPRLTVPQLNVSAHTEEQMDALATWW